MDVIATSLMTMLQLHERGQSLFKGVTTYMNIQHGSHLSYQQRAWRCLHGWASLTSTIKPKGHRQLRSKFKASMGMVCYLQTWNHRKALLRMDHLQARAPEIDFISRAIPARLRLANRPKIPAPLPFQNNYPP
jgi:hypothetical protein